MKRIVEKVKDIVEVCPFTHLHDFAADPSLTLSGYHFTDITADLMAKWIDRVSSIKTGHGAALALAGFRGVGKSHFLAVIAAIVSRPELRARIADQHVTTCADRLSRRHNPVAFVLRGSGNSLLEELKKAIADILDVGHGTLSDSLHELLLKASERSGELPLVVLIDTATNRESRVARDDGTFLTEIAEAAKSLGIFVGVALDDDISGADGPNSSITGSFKIDYLDQEHLYKIVDTHIFSKHYQKLPVLHDIYEFYRAALPGFRWSEQRFSSLYPLHPATLEIAPLIRLYVHDFALLGFASEAGVKILGRPANSLIGLDEVFDGVESKLRGVADLKEAFAAFDKLERDVITKTPVQQRLPAKLILKGLFMLSLNGQGSTAAEIAASMMIFDDSESGAAGLDVVELLKSLVAALPDSIKMIDPDSTEPKYCFKLAAKEDVNSLLAEAVKDIPDEIVWSVLQRQTAEKFSDIDISGEFGTRATKCSVEWRGAIRRGEIVWNASESGDHSRDRKDLPDWMVFVDSGNDEKVITPDALDCQSLVWKLAGMTTDEKDTIRRHHLLQTNAGVREEFGEGLTTATHIHSIAVEKIWQRLFLQDGTLIAGDAEYPFVEEARSAHSLTQLFTGMLRPVFESQYPFHPEFAEILSKKPSSTLITDFFGGAGPNNADVQKLADAFAFPLGLAAKQGDAYVPASAEVLADLVVVNAAFDGLETNTDTGVPLAGILSRLRATPFGLTREAQHLILAALVAQRHFEFVTSSGNRINHRSLDLQIIWDDIIGVAKPLEELYSPERLLSWAKLITGNSGIDSLDRSEDRLLIIDSLSGWLAGWRESRILDEFDALPDESLNAAIWRTAANLRKSFGSMADNIGALVNNDVSLDQCLQAIAELFSDSEAEFESKKSDLRVLKDFTAGASLRAEVTAYLSLCEMTGDISIEDSRQALLVSMGAGHVATAADNDRFKKLWSDFKEQYLNYYAEKHDALMTSLAHGQELNEILSSDAWSMFESYSAIPWFDKRYVSKTKEFVRELRHSYCDSKVREMLESKPFCSCSFRLSASDRLVGLPKLLQKLVDSGLDAFRSRLKEDSKKLVEFAASDAISASLKQILAGFVAAKTMPQLTSQEVRLMKIAAERAVEVSFDDRNAKRATVVDDVSNLLSNEFQNWDQEVERLEVFLNTEL